MYQHENNGSTLEENKVFNKKLPMRVKLILWIKSSLGFSKGTLKLKLRYHIQFCQYSKGVSLEFEGSLWSKNCFLVALMLKSNSFQTLLMLKKKVGFLNFFKVEIKTFKDAWQIKMRR